MTNELLQKLLILGFLTAAKQNNLGLSQKSVDLLIASMPFTREEISEILAQMVSAGAAAPQDIDPS